MSNSPPTDELPDAPPIKCEEDDATTIAIKDEPVRSSPPPQDLPESKKRDDVKTLFDDDDDNDVKGGNGDDDDGGEDYGDMADDADMLAAVAMPAQSSSAGYSDPQVMYAFYQRLFPWRQLFQWLNHSPVPSHDFGHREFAFTLQNDAYLRYQSFPTFETLRRDVLRLNPSRFEIGPVYSANPRDRKSLTKAAFRPLAKELVFDIDLTDYDDVRTCCDKANICLRCWQFVTVAIRILDAALRDDLGFRHVLWVYSGRRGAHAWVCDKRARLLDDQKRRAAAAYLEVVRGGDKAGKRVSLRRPLHMHLARSLDVLKESFGQTVLRDQDPWRSADKAERLLELLPEALASELRKRWQAEPGRSSTEKWGDIDSVASQGRIKSLNTQQLRDAKQDIVFEYLYPRLDAEVSKHLNHLLKSPFVVHPGTGRVCVPIDPARADEFDPLTVPTVTQLLTEIDRWDGRPATPTTAAAAAAAAGEEEKKVADVDKTSLKPYVDYFRRFVATLLREEMGDSKKLAQAQAPGGKRERPAAARADAMEF